MCSRDYPDITRTLNSTPGPSRPHIMHISRKNTGTSRMCIDREKSHYTVDKVPLTKSRLGWGLFLSSATKQRKVTQTSQLEMKVICRWCSFLVPSSAPNFQRWKYWVSWSQFLSNLLVVFLFLPPQRRDRLKSICENKHRKLFWGIVKSISHFRGNYHTPFPRLFLHSVLSGMTLNWPA